MDAIAIQCEMPTARLVRALRGLTSRSLAEIQASLRTMSLVASWDTDDRPFDQDLHDRIDEVQAQISLLTEMAPAWQLFYRPSAEEPWEEVTMEEVKNLHQSELIYSLQQHD